MGNIFKISCAVDTLVLRCWDFTVKKTTYTRKLKENFKDLKHAVKKLQARREDLQRMVELAEEKLLERLAEVEVWLSEAESIIKEAELLMEAGPKEIDNLCLGGCFSKNCKSGYKFGTKVAEKCEEIATLMSQGVFPAIADNRRAAQMEVLPHVERFVGQQSIFEEVWRSLVNDEAVGVIGLYGLGGVGKTTLLTHINNNFFKAAPTANFDVVIFVEVSGDYTIEKVQEKIGKKIGLSNDQSWKNKTCDEKRRDIFQVLSRKKFVMLLDELWEPLDLMKVGITIPSQDNGSKLVFSTWNLSICGAMKAQKKFEVKCLGPAEAWDLFEEKVGRETIASHPDIKEAAEIVVEDCDGLPLALVTIGQAMAFQDNPQSWRAATISLKQPAHEEMKKVYERLKISYDRLDEKAKSFLLYCSLYAADYKIPKLDLIYCCMCEGVLGEISDPKSAFAEGYGVVDSLVNASLLEEEEGKEHVKMHSVVRGMAIWIGSLGEAQNIRTLVLTGARQTEAPEIGRWEGVQRISLMQNQIRMLVGRPECSALKTLFLNNNGLVVIAAGFLHSMSNLKVLDLSGNENLLRLPVDISKLTALERLNLTNTGIRELPTQLKALTRLKHLFLLATHLKQIPRRLISSFPRLEQFKMFTSPTYLPSDEEETGQDNVLSGGNEALVEELEGLQKLETVHLEIKNNVAYSRLLSSPKLKGCLRKLYFFTFRENLHLTDMEDLEALEFYYHYSSDIKLQTSLTAGNTCFNRLRTVIMFHCHQIRDMTWLIHIPTVQNLLVAECDKLEHLISEEKLSEVNEVIEIPNPFPHVEYLFLANLRQLKSIFWESLPFPHMTRIHVYGCPNLNKLPLNSDFANNENLVIEGDLLSWLALEWEDETTQQAILSRLKVQTWV